MYNAAIGTLITSRTCTSTHAQPQGHIFQQQGKILTRNYLRELAQRRVHRIVRPSTALRPVFQTPRTTGPQIPSASNNPQTCSKEIGDQRKPNSSKQQTKKPKNEIIENQRDICTDIQRDDLGDNDTQTGMLKWHCSYFHTNSIHSLARRWTKHPVCVKISYALAQCSTCIADQLF